jgi:hypothetical protein
MSPLHVRRWFALAPREQLWVGTLLAIVLVGLTARHLHGCRTRTDTTPAPIPAPQKNPVEIPL